MNKLAYIITLVLKQFFIAIGAALTVFVTLAGIDYFIHKRNDDDVYKRLQKALDEAK